MIAKMGLILILVTAFMVLGCGSSIDSPADHPSIAPPLGSASRDGSPGGPKPSAPKPSAAPAPKPPRPRNELLTSLDAENRRIDAVGKKLSERMPESARHEIFTAVAKAQDRAEAEAERAFPINPKNIPNERLGDVDWMKAELDRHFEEADRRSALYEKQLYRQFHIAEDEFRAIKSEAFAKKWPLP